MPSLHGLVRPVAQTGIERKRGEIGSGNKSRAGLNILAILTVWFLASAVPSRASTGAEEKGTPHHRGSSSAGKRPAVRSVRRLRPTRYAAGTADRRPLPVRRRCAGATIEDHLRGFGIETNMRLSSTASVPECSHWWSAWSCNWSNPLGGGEPGSPIGMASFTAHATSVTLQVGVFKPQVTIRSERLVCISCASGIC